MRRIHFQLLSLSLAACLIGHEFAHAKSAPKEAAPAATKSAGPQDVDFGPYMADLQRRIKSHWNPPKHLSSKRVKVQFKVYRSGKLENLRVSTSSGDSTADDAAMAAVRKTGDVAPLPDGSPPDVDIEFTFDYAVSPGRINLNRAIDTNASSSATMLAKGFSAPGIEYLAKATISANKNRPWVTASDMADQKYLNTIQESISKNWTPASGSDAKETNIGFTMSREGRVSNLKVEKGDPSGDFEKAAIKAIESAAPFPAAPPSAPETVRFVIWF
jgi:TonB family protein